VTEKAKRSIDNILTPFFKDGIDKLNKNLKKEGVQIGAEFKWFIDFIDNNE